MVGGVSTVVQSQPSETMYCLACTCRLIGTYVHTYIHTYVHITQVCNDLLLKHLSCSCVVVAVLCSHMLVM